MPTLYLPCDSLARAVGADEVATALITQAHERPLSLELQRTSSRGLYWLEPLLEVDTPQGRFGFGPLTAADVPSVLEALGDPSAHPLALGLVEDLPYLKTQQRLLFARAGITRPLSLDDYRAHGGFEGLNRSVTLGGRRPRLRCSIQACVAVAAQPSQPGSNGARCASPKRRKSTSCATPTKATPAPLPTAC